MKDIIVGFGEIMGRLEADGYLRLRQAMPGNLNITFAGAEGSVLVSVQIMGKQTRFVTALPTNSIGDACLDSVRRFGIDTDYIVRKSGRLGLYFLETGANQRPSNVIYDRTDSVVSVVSADEYDWDNIFTDANWFHISGITPAISSIAAEASLIAVREAKKHHVSVSCDLNFRKKLWNWDSFIKPRDLAEKTMRNMLPYVDLIIGNEEDAAEILGIHAEGTDVEKGKLVIEKYPDVAREIVNQFPSVSRVAITLRESISANHNNWGGMLFDAATDQAYFAPKTGNSYKPYQIKNIVDRVGGGDSFSAGLIYAFNDKDLKDDPQSCVSFAVAASCLCHSVKGDFNYSSREDVISLMNGNTAGRVTR